MMLTLKDLYSDFFVVGLTGCWHKHSDQASQNGS